MGEKIGIESIEGTPKVYLPGQALLYKDIQVPVHRSHAEIRELPFQPFIQPGCCGMNSRALQECEDAIPLTAVFILPFDDANPFKIVFGTILILIQPTGFVKKTFSDPGKPPPRQDRPSLRPGVLPVLRHPSGTLRGFIRPTEARRC